MTKKAIREAVVVPEINALTGKAGRKAKVHQTVGESQGKVF